jgi:hypothetical protein
MGIMVGLVFFAIGAIFTFAINASPSGFSLDVVGVIIMLCSAVGIGLALYRDIWRRRVFEESIEQGSVPPTLPDDGVVMVEPTTPIEPRRGEHIDIDVAGR